MSQPRSLGLRFGGAKKHFNFPVVEPVSDAPVQAEPEFLEPVEEDDRDIEFGVLDTVVSTAPTVTLVSDDLYDNIPSTGSWLSPTGVEYRDGVPAFLFSDRPRSNIR